MCLSPPSGQRFSSGWELCPFILICRASGYYSIFSMSIFFLITFYRLCYYSCPKFSAFAPLHPALLTLSGNPHTIVHVYGLCIQVLWLLDILYCTSHSHGYSLTTYLYFWIPSPLHPFPYTPLPSKCSPYPWCCLCSCLLSLFLDSTVDRYMFFAILFIVLIFFFLNKSL